MRAVIAFGLAVLAAPASALVPPLPVCYITEGPEFDQHYSYDPRNAGNGFVTFTARTAASDGEDWVAVLEYCPTRQQLVVTVEDYEQNLALGQAAYEVFDTMVYGQASYTMEQMRDALAGLGTRTEIRTISYESCACEIFMN